MIYDDLYIFEKWWLVHSSIPSTAIHLRNVRGGATLPTATQVISKGRGKGRKGEKSMDGGPESPKRFSFMGFSRTEIPEILESLKVYRKSLSNFGWFGFIFEETLNHWIAENKISRSSWNLLEATVWIIRFLGDQLWTTLKIIVGVQ